MREGVLPAPHERCSELTAAIQRGLGIVESVLYERNVREKERILRLDQREPVPRVALRLLELARERARVRRSPFRDTRAEFGLCRAAGVGELGEDPQALLVRGIGDVVVALLVSGAGQIAQCPSSKARRDLHASCEEVADAATPSAGACGPQKASRAEASSSPSTTSVSAAQSRAARRSSRSASATCQSNGSSSSSLKWAVWAISSIRSAWRRRTYVVLAGLLEPFRGELADRLEHPVALLAEPAGAAPKEALVEKRGERVESASQTASADSSVQPPRKTESRLEETLLALVEKVVRPRDRRP